MAKALETLLKSKPKSVDASRPKFEAGATGAAGKARLMTLMGELRGAKPQQAHGRPPAPTVDDTATLRLAAADTYMKNDVLSIQEDIVDHVEYTLARSRVNFDNFEAYQATSLSLRDRLIERWNDTQTWFK